LCEQFDIFEKNGKVLNGCSEYKEGSGRKRVRIIKLKWFEGESADTDMNLSPQDKFHTGIFLAIRQNDWCIQETTGCVYLSPKFVLGFA